MAESWSIAVDVGVDFGHERMAFALDTRVPRVAVVGASGAGKSTLLRVLAGTESRAHGSVRVAGTCWQDSDGFLMPPWQRRVGWVPQDACLFPHRSAAQNLAWTRPEPVQLRAVAEMLEIDHLLHRRPRNLSGGERQRVALGRALLARPRLLLLDEPFAALDRPLRSRLTTTVVGFCDRRGIRFVLVSHDSSDVAAMGDEVWQLSDGRLQRIQT